MKRQLALAATITAVTLGGCSTRSVSPDQAACDAANDAFSAFLDGMGNDDLALAWVQGDDLVELGERATDPGVRRAVVSYGLALTTEDVTTAIMSESFYDACERAGVSGFQNL
jgi:FlaG/FlaF family flagellin (archaellin)